MEHAKNVRGEIYLAAYRREEASAAVSKRLRDSIDIRADAGRASRTALSNARLSEDLRRLPQIPRSATITRT